MSGRIPLGHIPSLGEFEWVRIIDGAGHYLNLPSLTTAQRDDLAADNGMVIYNSTSDSIQSYENGAWGDMAAGEIAAHAADFGLHAKVVRKTADQTVNNSVVLQNDDELLLAVAANEVWIVRFLLNCNSSIVADMKVIVTVPAGATGSYFMTREGSAPAAQPLGSDRSINGLGADRLSAVLTALVINGANAGNIQLQWAQNVAEVSDTKVLANSCIIATKLA